jgi:hypothetical protein
MIVTVPVCGPTKTTQDGCHPAHVGTIHVDLPTYFMVGDPYEENGVLVADVEVPDEEEEA